MCGISLVLDPPGDAAERVRRMHAPIRHRGPDGEGFLAVRHDGSIVSGAAAASADGARLAIAFRRLRILDLSEAAAQPMASEDGLCWIAFNGEAYNFRELRDELRAGGAEFRSRGDTEVVLRAYQAWGETCFARLDGMWAVAIVDLARRRLVLSRDRFGIKPLYWARDGSALLVASEARQILAARDEVPRPNAPLVGMFLRGSRYPCLDETFFEGVHAVPPATWCEVLLDGAPPAPVFHRYWDLSEFHADPHNATAYDRTLERFDGLVREAVRSHAVADVRLGSLLSGGLDSSTIAALLGPVARKAGRDCPTFSFGVRNGEPRWCELPYAETVARAHGLENHQAGFDVGWLRQHAGAAIRAMEEPPLALAAVAQYRTFQLCREHATTVVLDGQGADEVLGGYPYHQRLLVADRLRHGRIADARRELRAIAARDRVSRVRLLGALVGPPLARRARRRPAWLAPAEERADDEARRARADRGRDASAVNRQLYWDVKWGNVKIVLGYTDKNAMAHSVEARVPFFDRALVEFAFSLPDHFKVGDGQRKRILRDAARRTLPREVTERPDRMGFAMPTRALMRELAPDVRAAVLDDGLLGARWFVRRRAERLLDRFAAGDDDLAEPAWRLYAMAVWAREFGVALA